MNKFTLMTFQSYRESLLTALQRFQNVHFKDLQRAPEWQESGAGEGASPSSESLEKVTSREQTAFYESELAKIRFAHDRLAPYMEKPKGMAALTTPKKLLSFEEFHSYAETYDYQSVYDRVKAEDEKRKEIRGEKNKLKAENDLLKSWNKLDVSPGQLDQLKSAACFLGVVSKTPPDVFREGVESQWDTAYVEILGHMRDETAVLVIVPQNVEAEALTVMKNLGFAKTPLNIGLAPAAQIEENTRRTAALDEEDGRAVAAIREMSGECPKLQIAADYYNTALERAKACENFLKTENVLLIEGWVPSPDSGELTSILRQVCGEDYYLEEAPEARDSTEVPIKLKNGKMTSAFESITNMYALPRYNEIDPTPLLMPFYLVFFGLMIGDAGYGLVMVLGTFLALKYFNLTDGMRDFMRFFLYLGFAVIGAGIIYGSFFSFTVIRPIAYVDPATNMTAYKAILDSNTDIIQMLIISIILGVVQVVFGLLVKGYMLIRDGDPLSAVFDSLFFILVLLTGIGLILNAAGILPPALGPVCWWGFWAMLAGLALTQGRRNETIAGKMGEGLYAVYGLTSYVGDLVSYTRIVALGLSGAFIGFAFIQMADLIPHPLKFIFGSLIFLFGTLMNLGLAALGAYVHSCRLQYVEYFSKFYEGGGKTFKPLRMIVNSIQVK